MYSFWIEAKPKVTMSWPRARPGLRRTPHGRAGPSYPTDPSRPNALQVSPTRPVNAFRESSSAPSPIRSESACCPR